jgi:hypothetical protein
MKRPKICTYCFLSPLLVGILACAGCSDIAQRFKPAHRTVPHECIASASICAVQFNACDGNPNPGKTLVPLGYAVLWRKPPKDSHAYSIHFKARTPINPSPTTPVMVVPTETPSQPVNGDSQCSQPTTNNNDPNCYFSYYLNRDDTNTKCSDPGIQIIPN